MNGRVSKKLVLYLPRRDDPSRGEPYSADLLPLELLQIAGGPVQEGFEVVLIDANIEVDPLARVLEACEGALCFAASAILGYQVTDGERVARVVRERFPGLPIVWGGWFPTVKPEMYFEGELADAVVLGQGELTFLEVAQALQAGEALEGVAGLALWRDGELLHTPARAMVGFDALPPTPWQLLDFEPYRFRQLELAGDYARHRMPIPQRWKKARAPVSFSFNSSYGCPCNCTFCCSPDVTGRRWKAIEGAVLADQLAELQARFGFEAVRFHDANWSLDERRALAFCARLRENGTELHWNATTEVETVVRYEHSSLDELAESGCHFLWLGAETGTEAMQQRIRKNVPLDRVPEALQRLIDRRITTGCFWIIGFPHETLESMRATVQAAARLKHQFPGYASDLYPFRALPGTEDYQEAKGLGWRLPETFEEWGRCFEWKWNTEANPLPAEIRKQWFRYLGSAAHYDRKVNEGPRWARALVRRLAGWRLRNGNFAFPAEQKLFDLLTRSAT